MTSPFTSNGALGAYPAMTPELHWHNDQDRNRGRGWTRYMFAGNGTQTIATMTRSDAWWEGEIRLPGLRPRRTYATKGAMEADIEAKVTAWFAEILS